MTSYGHIIVDLCIISFNLNYFMQLKQFHNIATKVSTTFGDLPDCLQQLKLGILSICDGDPPASNVECVFMSHVYYVYFVFYDEDIINIPKRLWITHGMYGLSKFWQTVCQPLYVGPYFWYWDCHVKLIVNISQHSPAKQKSRSSVRHVGVMTYIWVGQLGHQLQRLQRWSLGMDK